MLLVFFFGGIDDLIAKESSGMVSMPELRVFLSSPIMPGKGDFYFAGERR